MRILLGTLILIFLVSSPVSAQVGDSFEVDITFDMIDRSTSTFFINDQDGLLEPPFYVYQANDGLTGLFNKNINVGDGSDGVFNATTYAQFSEGGDLSGNIIRLNLATYPELNVTEFDLEAGWTIEPIGNTPLIIRSTGTVNIAGTIDCSGEDGEDGRAGMGDRDVVSLGGQGVCGGGNGGDGGYQSTNATNGTEVGVLPIGPGQAGGRNTADANGAGGGGGGGAFAPDTPGLDGPSDGKDNGGFALGGPRGTSFEDNVIATQGGGSGGGGGGYADFGGSGGTGGGGGAGGGSVYIFARGNIDIDGFIDASGGDGGAEADTSGPGGGGGGGTVFIISRGIINVAGNVNAERGQGGSSAGNDGDGGQGRTFVNDLTDDNDFGFTGVAANVLPPALFADWGKTLSRVAGPAAVADPTEVSPADYYEIETQVLDTEARSFEVTDFTVYGNNPGNGIVVVQMKGARTEAALELTDYETLASGTTKVFQDSRFYKVRVRATNTSRQNPLQITGLVVNFSKSQVNSFEFKSDGGGCGAILPLVGSGGSGPGNADGLREALWWQSLLLLTLLLAPLSLIFFRRKKRFQLSTI